jgi:hypothetical protein
MNDLDDAYYAHESPLSFTNYENNKTSVPEIRVKSSCSVTGLGISKHERGFSLRDSKYLGYVYYSAERVRTILQMLIAASTAYPSVIGALRDAVAWVDAHK